MIILSVKCKLLAQTSLTYLVSIDDNELWFSKRMTLFSAGELSYKVRTLWGSDKPSSNWHKRVSAHDIPVVGRIEGFSEDAYGMWR